MTTAEAVRRRQRETNLLLILVAVLILAAGVYQFAFINPRSADIQAGLKDAQEQLANRQLHTRAILVETCRQRNVLRRAVQQILRDQIAQTKAANLERFFPQIPPDALNRLIAQQNQRRRAEIDALSVTHCRTTYR